MQEMPGYIKDMGFQVDLDCNQNRLGQWCRFDNPKICGRYWYFENDLYVADIHDFFIREEFVMSFAARPDSQIVIISSYILSGNGECLEPYQNLSNDSLFLLNPLNANTRYLLHANCPYKSVGIKFKRKMLEHYLADKLKLDQDSINQVFYLSKTMALQPLAKLASDILSQDLDAPNAELFIDAKALEWLSLTVEAYTRAQVEREKLLLADDQAIELVAAYISDHYASTIRQETLEHIALMSGTKLKNCFKTKYHMTITEYIQRKRMNAAELLLFNTNMYISSIAQAVGYKSSSHFSELYRRYKGCNPSETRRK